MKKFIKTVAFIVSCMHVFAGRGQDSSANNGIHFEHAANWKQILRKAKKENKYIFVDCYATWCGPCKMMAEKIFPLKTVGDSINKKFISVKMQMDSSKSDDEQVKSWYHEAHSVMEKYEVYSFPTYLFFDIDGNPVQKAGGASPDPKSFLGKASSVFDTAKQYFKLMSHYNEHLGDSAYLGNALHAALRVEDYGHVESILGKFLPLLKNPFKKEILELVMGSTESSQSVGFVFFMTHLSEIDTSLGMGDAERFLKGIIRMEDIDPIAQKNLPLINWDSLELKLSQKYPALSDEVILEYKPEYFKSRGMWDDYDKSTKSFMDKYSYRLNTGDLNGMAWDVWQYCRDKDVLIRALGWSEQAVKQEANEDFRINYMDTYAHLQYKLGNSTAAIAWETKAAESMAKLSVKIGRYGMLGYDREKVRSGYLAVIQEMQENKNITQ